LEWERLQALAPRQGPVLRVKLERLTPLLGKKQLLPPQRVPGLPLCFGQHGVLGVAQGTLAQMWAAKKLPVRWESDFQTLLVMAQTMTTARVAAWPRSRLSSGPEWHLHQLELLRQMPPRVLTEQVMVTAHGVATCVSPPLQQLEKVRGGIQESCSALCCPSVWRLAPLHHLPPFQFQRSLASLSAQHSQQVHKQLPMCFVL